MTDELVIREDFWKLEDAMPCPFCGSRNIIHDYLDEEGYETVSFYQMERIYALCCDCGCGINIGDRPDILDELDAKKAITERWNERRPMILKETL